LEDILRNNFITRTFQSLSDLSRKITGENGLDETLRLCLAILTGPDGFDCGGIYLKGKSSLTWTLARQVGLTADVWRETAVSGLQYPWTGLSLGRGPLYLSREQIMAAIKPEYAGEGFQSLAAVPLLENGEIIGTLNLASRQMAGISSVAQTLIEHVAGCAAAALSYNRTSLALKAAEEHFKDFSELSADFAWCYRVRPDQTFAFEWEAGSIFRLTGYTVRELMREGGLIKIAHPESLPLFEERKKTVLAGNPHEGNFRFVTKDGKDLWVSLVSRAIRNDRGELDRVVTAGRDITENVKAAAEIKKVEDQLSQIQKMEAVGTLASGIAHEFNNTLQSISGYVHLLGNNADLPETDRDYLDGIGKNLTRASELVRSLMAMSRQAEAEFKPVNVNEMAIRAVNLLSRTIPRMINIDTELAEDLKVVQADQGQIEQVILNLGINAKESMPDGGKLIIETQNITVEADKTEDDSPIKPGEYVQITVADTGRGMDEETRKRSFEPFFTTKKLGEGSGLGLTLVYGIARNHGGFVTMSSVENIGTVASVYLPADQTQSQPAVTKPSAVPRGDAADQGIILLVDDEADILIIGQEILKQFGYSVLMAESGEKALEVYRVHDGGIDLVILDLGMPGMGGEKCLKELLKLNPEVKVIITSGYGASGRARSAIEGGAAAFLKKPYSVMEMLDTVRGVMAPTKN